MGVCSLEKRRLGGSSPYISISEERAQRRWSLALFSGAQGPSSSGWPSFSRGPAMRSRQEDTCPICLGPLEDPAGMDLCWHAFCHACIQLAVCPEGCWALAAALLHPFLQTRWLGSSWRWG
uniref:RING-type domain-containing protein n=1 Tax=Aquila chrysaetos chrysaetos TaxID=223781 RepID=A0A663ETM4_AQUCH